MNYNVVAFAFYEFDLEFSKWNYVYVIQLDKWLKNKNENRTEGGKEINVFVIFCIAA